MSRIVAIAGGRGGVGSTTTAINLASALTSYTRDVSLVDANIPSPHIGIHLGSSKAPILLNHVMDDRFHMLNAVYRHSSGFKVIPASLKISDSRNTSLKNLRNHLNFLSSDLILIDLASGVNEHSEHAMSASDEVLIITNPEITSITDSLRMIQMARSLGKSITGVVLSRTGALHELSPSSVEQMLGYRIIANIPEDSNVNLSLRKNSIVVDSYPDSPASLAYKKLAARLTGQNFVEDDSHWLEKFAKALGFK